ncbi:FitA-like ribbon-helix-helix domain-containing protein [Jiella sonneratiae]|uniref:Antitoxin FitA-like ribbon-helix-helix domain-containing protein n=1 Tax=Jiella sonneratiae TaxID=2816856 RepID=A0ABS3J640_9HYPH|nr:hypothetical protein [Jiella sonneratiae]MBO0905144.1 hypothetical protein [Jiella sonneratiae]
MASLTIDHLEDAVLERLEVMARDHNRSLAEEAKSLLLESLSASSVPKAGSKAELDRRVARVIAEIESGGGVSDLGVELGQPALVGHPVRSPEEQKRVLAAISALGKKPAEPFDQKAFTDELWSFVE